MTGARRAPTSFWRLLRRACLWLWAQPLPSSPQGSDTPSPLLSPGTRVLASGSVRIPRFMLLESGGLQISPVSVQDAGDYTCYAANAEGALNASATLTVWSKGRRPGAPTDSRSGHRVLCLGMSPCPGTSNSVRRERFSL